MTTDAGRARGVTASRSPLATPPRQFLLVLATTGAVAMWLYITVRFRRRLLGPLSVDVVLAGTSSDDLAERWAAFVAAVLVYSHLPVLAVLACWGVGLVVHFTVRSWREPLPEQVKTSVGERVVLTPALPTVMRHEPAGSVPPVGTFWGAMCAGALATRAARATPTGGWPAPWEGYAPAQWVGLLWWAVAVLVAVSTAALHLRRRRYLRGLRNSPRVGRAARGQPLRFRPDDPPATPEEKRADGLLVGAIACAVLGLGPLGLALGVRWLRHTSTGWGGVLVLVLNVLSTLVIVAALVLAVAAG